MKKKNEKRGNLIFLFVFVTIALSFSSSAYSNKPNDEINPDEIEMPMKSGADRFVVDLTNVLSPQTISSVNNMIKSLRLQTSVEMAVIVVPDTGDFTLEDFSEKIFQKWGLGKADKDNGLLLTLDMGDKRARIQTGYGLEGVLTDVECSSIINQVLVPEMQQKGPDAAVASTVHMICSMLENPEYIEELKSSQSENRGVEPLDKDIIISFVGIVVFLIFLLGFVAYRNNLKQVNQLPGYDYYGRAIGWKKIMPTLWLTGIFSGIGLIWPLLGLWQTWRWRNRKRICRNCSSKMKKLSEKEDNSYLDSAQDLEEKLGTVDYDVWLCPKCGETEKLPFVKDQNVYTRCPHCNVIARKKIGERVVVPPTVRREGMAEDIYECLYCHHRDENLRKLPRKEDATLALAALGAAAAASRSGGGGMNSGGFGGFGGGSTGGGGASGGW